MKTILTIDSPWFDDPLYETDWPEFYDHARRVVPEPYQSGDHVWWTGREDCYTRPEGPERSAHGA